MLIQTAIMMPMQTQTQTGAIMMPMQTQTLMQMMAMKTPTPMQTQTLMQMMAMKTPMQTQTLMQMMAMKTPMQTQTVAIQFWAHAVLMAPAPNWPTIRVKPCLEHGGRAQAAVTPGLSVKPVKRTVHAVSMTLAMS
jgi:hypothetical protein